MKNFKKVQYTVYTAIANLIYMLLQDAGLTLTAERYNIYVATAGIILVAFGILADGVASKNRKKPIDKNPKL